jgi:transcriptional regulator with XRE-family HTH domain
MSPAERFWEEEGYGEIVAVEPIGGVLAVEFANGDRIEVSLDSLGADRDTKLMLGENGALLAIGPGGEREIDWMVIRASADSAFAAELRERDAEESRRIGRRLRALRQNKGLSLKASAEMAGMSSPQLAKIEKGETDLRISTVRSVLRPLGASFADIAGPDAPEVSVPELIKRASKAGAPKETLAKIAVKLDPRRLADALSRGFAWEPQALLSGAPENPELNFAVAFKARSPEKARQSPMLRLARTLSEISSEAFEQPPAELPDGPDPIREQIGAEITLEALAEWAWDAGIMVLPMGGPDFSAAAWHVGERPAVVLKAKQEYSAHWLFELAHELGHVLLGHAAGETGVVDVDQPQPLVAAIDEQEQEANEFALRLLIPERERLLEEIRIGSGQSTQEQKWNFKGQVERVAAERRLAPGLLGFVAAYGLPEVAETGDRWGSATNLAKEEAEARPIIRAALRRHINFAALSELDRALVEAVVLE